MAITVKEEHYKNFGMCICISNEKQEMKITTEMGPRIISYNLVGKKNMMFNDLERLVKRDNEEYRAVYGEDKTWYILGGHRFWVSPESYPITYYPDNDPVEYKREGNVFTFTSPVQNVTGWQTAIEITFHETQAKADVKHILTNKSGETKEGSIWALSVTAAGGRVFQRMADENTGLLANRSLILWPYSKISDERFYIDDEFIAVSQDRKAETNFKIGTNNTKGSVICLNNGTVFKKEYVHEPDAIYPDNGCSTEVFSSNLILEMETLSPLYNFAPGESHEHLEKWSLTPEESINLEEVVKHL